MYHPSHDRGSPQEPLSTLVEALPIPFDDINVPLLFSFFNTLNPLKNNDNNFLFSFVLILFHHNSHRMYPLEIRFCEQDKRMGQQHSANMILAIPHMRH